MKKSSSNPRKNPSDAIAKVRRSGHRYVSNSSVYQSYDPPISVHSGYKFSTVQNALAEYHSGSFANAALMGDLVLTDGKIASSFAQRTGVVANIYSNRDEVDIKPASSDAVAVYIADYFKENLWDSIKIANVKDYISDNGFYGWHVAQVVEQEDSELLGIERWQPSLTYYRYSERRFVGITMDGGSELMVPNGNKWLVCSSQSNLYRSWMRGMITYLAPLWLAKQYAVMDWSKFITSWARAIKALTAPNDLSAPQKARLMSDMQNLEQGRDYIYLPNGAMLSAITVPSQNGDAVGSFIEAIDKQFSVAILGMDVDADGGAYNAVGTVYEGIVLGTVRDDIASVNESFLRPAVRAMTQRLFGSRSLAPSVTVSAKSIQYKMQNSDQQPKSNSRKKEVNA